MASTRAASKWSIRGARAAASGSCCSRQRRPPPADLCPPAPAQRAGAPAARGGSSLADVAERVGAAREQLRMWFAVDTLEYLRRGGRIGGAQAWMGSALKIKPILTLDGEITPIERVRTSKRAFARMVDYLHELEAAGRDGWVVQHI